MTIAMIQPGRETAFAIDERGPWGAYAPTRFEGGLEHALIVGGGNMGFETAKQFLSAPMRVTVVDRDPGVNSKLDELRESTDFIRATQRFSLTLADRSMLEFAQLDVTDEESRRQFVARTRDNRDTFNHIVFIVGGAQPWEKEGQQALTEARLLSSLMTNYGGPHLLVSNLLPFMVGSAGCSASITFTSSVDICGASHRQAYDAAKHALIGIVNNLADQATAYGDIRVNAVVPGSVESTRTNAMRAQTEIISEETTLLRRGTITKPGNVARAIVATALNADITGAVNFVDQGQSKVLGFTPKVALPREKQVEDAANHRRDVGAGYAGEMDLAGMSLEPSR